MTLERGGWARVWTAGWVAIAIACGTPGDDVPATPTPPEETPTPTDVTPTPRPEASESQSAATPTPPPPPTAEPTPALTATQSPTPAATDTPAPSASPTQDLEETPEHTPTPRPTPTLPPPTEPPPPTDDDGDGYLPPQDCDNTAAAIHPGAAEVCDSLDQDCDALIDEDLLNTYYQDSDQDSYGNSNSTVKACSQPTGYVSDNHDCNDANASANPQGIESCDQVDNDCDNKFDEGVKTTFYRDNDGDGYGIATSTVLACSATANTSPVAGDCNDSNASIYPSAPESCDAFDNNCNGAIDEGLQGTWYVDADGDGYGNSAGPYQLTCSQPVGYVGNNGDCNDSAYAINPAAAEVCDTRDNNCDGAVDETGPFWYPDSDGDGYGANTSPLPSCVKPETGAASSTGDCNDSAATINPGKAEICGDTIDNNCDGRVDEGVDQDNDGYDNCSGDDCDDTRDTVYPFAQEVWGDGIDQDCDGHIDADIYVSEERVTPEPSKPLHGSIQAAINQAVAGQLIAVDFGTYREAVNFHGKAVKLKSMYGPSYTSIDANASGTTLLVNSGETPDTIVEGFTITGGTGSTGSICGYANTGQWGGGVCVKNADITLIHNVIFSNMAASGGGISITGGSPLLLGNRIEANYAEGDGGGVYLRGTEATFIGNTFVYNQADSRGGGMFLYGSDATFYNNIFTGNIAMEWGGGLILQDSNPLLVNNTISSNTAYTGGGIHVYEYDQPQLTNNIVAFNRTTGQGANIYIFNRNNYVSFNYNCFYDSRTGGSGVDGKPISSTDLVVNPRFVDDYVDNNWADDDYHLQSSSPAIDAAYPASLYNDLDGSRGDLGAYGGPWADQY